MSGPLIKEFKKQKLSVADLILDLHNFRTGTVRDQTSAIAALINRNANKMKGIITSISKKGLLIWKYHVYSLIL